MLRGLLLKSTYFWRSSGLALWSEHKLFMVSLTAWSSSFIKIIIKILREKQAHPAFGKQKINCSYLHHSKISSGNSITRRQQRLKESGYLKFSSSRSWGWDMHDDMYLSSRIHNHCIPIACTGWKPRENRREKKIKIKTGQHKKFVVKFVMICFIVINQSTLTGY